MVTFSAFAEPSTARKYILMLFGQNGLHIHLKPIPGKWSLIPVTRLGGMKQDLGFIQIMKGGWPLEQSRGSTEWTKGEGHGLVVKSMDSGTSLPELKSSLAICQPCVLSKLLNLFMPPFPHL